VRRLIILSSLKTAFSMHNFIVYFRTNRPLPNPPATPLSWLFVHFMLALSIFHFTTESFRCVYLTLPFFLSSRARLSRSFLLSVLSPPLPLLPLASVSPSRPRDPPSCRPSPPCVKFPLPSRGRSNVVGIPSTSDARARLPRASSYSQAVLAGVLSVFLDFFFRVHF